MRVLLAPTPPLLVTGADLVTEAGMDGRPGLIPAVGAGRGAQGDERIDVIGGPMHPRAFQAGFDDQLVPTLDDPPANREALRLEVRITDLVAAFFQIGQVPGCFFPRLPFCARGDLLTQVGQDRLRVAVAQFVEPGVEPGAHGFGARPQAGLSGQGEMLGGVAPVEDPHRIETVVVEEALLPVRAIDNPQDLPRGRRSPTRGLEARLVGEGQMIGAA